MSKKHNEDVIFKKDLIANGWTNELIEKLLPKQLKTGGWYVSTVKNAEATTTFIKTTGKTDNQYKTYPSKPINRRVAKFMETIAEELLKNNYSEAVVKGIMYDNLHRVFKEILK